MHGLILSSLQIQDFTVNLERELICLLDKRSRVEAEVQRAQFLLNFTPRILEQASSIIFTMISLWVCSSFSFTFYFLQWVFRALQGFYYNNTSVSKQKLMFYQIKKIIYRQMIDR